MKGTEKKETISGHVVFFGIAHEIIAVSISLTKTPKFILKTAEKDVFWNKYLKNLTVADLEKCKIAKDRWWVKWETERRIMKECSISIYPTQRCLADNDKLLNSLKILSVRASKLKKESSYSTTFPQKLAIGDVKEANIDPSRNAFERDRHRWVHSSAYRRQNGKQQVSHPGHYPDARTRRTHSDEVACLADTILKTYLDEVNPKISVVADRCLASLTAVSCQFHDAGHPPYGHSGEVVLNEIMKDHGYFESNAQNYRLSLAGIDKRPMDPTVGQIMCTLKYDKVVGEGEGKTKFKGYYESEMEMIELCKMCTRQDIDTHALVRFLCSVMDRSDEICYTISDLEDGIKKKELDATLFLFPSKRIREKLICDDLIRVFLIGMGRVELENRLGWGEPEIEDFIGAILKNVKSSYKLISILVDFTRDMRSSKYRVSFGSNLYKYFMPNPKRLLKEDKCRDLLFRQLKKFVYEILLSTSRLEMNELSGKDNIQKVFTAVCKNPKLLSDKPGDFREKYMKEIRESELAYKECFSGGYLIPIPEIREFVKTHGRYKDTLSRLMRIVCDFVACMTNDYISGLAVAITTGSSDHKYLV